MTQSRLHINAGETGTSGGLMTLVSARPVRVPTLKAAAVAASDVRRTESRTAIAGTALTARSTRRLKVGGTADRRSALPCKRMRFGVEHDFVQIEALVVREQQ